MATGVALLWACLIAGGEPVAVHFVQVAPQERPTVEWRRSPHQRRAVVLIQGLMPHPFSKENVERPSLRDWQKPGSHLVKQLAADGDVFAVAYGQNVPVDQVADQDALWGGLLRLRKMGYREVVLIGYSAGGLVARRVVEDYPDAGVTKVVQVGAPNAGSGWAKLGAVRKNQKAFLQSLTKEERRRTMQDRLDVAIPDNVEFVCVVGTATGSGDGVVSARSQWTPDLQAQGIPAVTVSADHLSMVRSAAGAKSIAEMVRTPQPRWSPAKVAAARKAILGELSADRQPHRLTPMLFGYNTNGFAHHRLEDALEILAELGYQSVAITLDNHVLYPYDADATRLKATKTVRRLLDKLKLRSVIETGARFILDPRRKHQPTLISSEPGERECRLEFLQSALVTAAALGSDAVSFWSGTPTDRAPRRVLMDRLVEGCEKLCDLAARLNVRLAFEPEPGMFIDTMPRFAQLFRRVDHPLFGLTLDIGHLHCQGEVPIARYLRHWRDRLWNVHIEDMRRGVHDHLMFGEGEIDFGPVLGTLAEIGYAGGIHVELSRHSHNAVETARQAITFLQAVRLAQS